MKHLVNVKKFLRNEDGAVTVDWVVLTAAIVGLAILAFNTIGDATSDMASDLAVDIASQ
ncbi:hypothetical protein DSM14862_03743 (plasmid) [Sulfitobacter indolifex]|uniref:Pilus assembly protein n=1 Tax=Sulfitobacter indolifex HEL-45 TaxID=391624 RepID=A0ABM9X1Z4_9RHOB|nr:hypothetical protein [Sulfitobacter indolifex]EDQ03510.1 hypothetical protein OIHEL45_20016 [Sulfitobacter indolifex HEL-45]UOA20526.1 hypothetical protein DSM14862_03364 [Sulfitobacter indolifex]UOA20905.1 hypothetical protein DSM14862_03743 [Sulfitobacter indolifex]